MQTQKSIQHKDKGLTSHMNNVNAVWIFYAMQECPINWLQTLCDCL